MPQPRRARDLVRHGFSVYSTFNSELKITHKPGYEVHSLCGTLSRRGLGLGLKDKIFCHDLGLEAQVPGLGLGLVSRGLVNITGCIAWSALEIF